MAYNRRIRWINSDVNGIYLVNSLAHKVVSRFRSFWKWRKPFNKRDKTQEKRCFDALLRSLPSPSIKVYTDGSSFGNPGPAGAGFVIEDEHGNYVTHYSRSLGVATNSKA